MTSIEPGTSDRARNRRRVLASIAALAVVALAGSAIWSAWPQPPAPASPGITSTPTVTPSASIVPSGGATAHAWTDTRTIPGSYGTLGDVTLAHDSQGWGTTDAFVFLCNQDAERSATFPALAELEAAELLVSPGEGEGGDSEAILVFTTQPAAENFMTQLRTAVHACEQVPLADTLPEGEPRWVHASTPYEAGEDAFLVGSHAELLVDGTWRESPGADVAMWVRQGRAIALAGSGGEYVGNVYTLRPDVIAELRAVIDHALPQMCRWTSAGC